jgi:hypothetical protein
MILLSYLFFFILFSFFV